MPSPGASFLNVFIKDKQREAGNEPSQLPSIQSAQSDAGQFNLEAARSGAARDGIPDYMMRQMAEENLKAGQNVLNRGFIAPPPKIYESIGTEEGWGDAHRGINQYK
tara:strand:+ start:414 stop:734 length:321 start_codon:yes stop_codon:yes gene_type:complete